MTDWMPEPEPTLQPSAQALPDVDFHLWRDAPAWRNLVLSAIALTAGLLALPLVATAPEVEGQATQDMGACQVNATSFSGASGSGEVVGFLSTDQALRLMQSTQFTSHLAINPDYVANVRSLVHLNGSIEGSRFVYLVPKDMTVRIGYHVDVAGGHLDPSLPCHYMPNLITRLAPK